MLAATFASSALAGGADRVPKKWHAPAWWLRQALCIHSYEGAWNANTGNGYYGGLQFLESTWYRAGGNYHPAFDSRVPFTVPVREQLYRAWRIYQAGGGSWREWGTAGRCGLR